MNQTEMISDMEIQPVRRTSAPMLADLPLSSMNTDQDDDVFRQRMQIMERIGAQLKTELLGMDTIIDRVIEHVRAWYVMPELMSRPTIICLWGLTGLGKTQLVRRLAQLLGFYDRFVEVQMDGFTPGARHQSSLSGVLSHANLLEGEPAILLLDEFQRYRTCDKNGDDVTVQRYQDVWALLSDGRLSPNLGRLSEIEYKLANSHYDEEQAGQDNEAAVSKPKAFYMDAWDAADLKLVLKTSASLDEIMRWSPQRVREALQGFRQNTKVWETDYSKLLIFVTGNLDEMYSHVANRVEDCDTDADIFHRLTKDLSVIDVKKALSQRFRPEQIARLGNNHLIYPSLPKSAYVALIRRECDQYLKRIAEMTQVKLVLDPGILDELYANSVFPSQGTRPVFSTIHAILGPLLTAVTVKIKELRGMVGGAIVPLRLHEDKRSVWAEIDGQSISFPVCFELEEIRQKSSIDFRTLLAVHEAGHGLVYGLLMGCPPQEICINLASYAGGYNSYVRHKAYSRRVWLNLICVSLAGREAEKLVFGEEACTIGAEHDYESATEYAARFVRHFGFGLKRSRVDMAYESEENLNTDIQPSNEEIEHILQTQAFRAEQLLQNQRDKLIVLVEALLLHGTISAEQFSGLVNIPLKHTTEGPLEPWHDLWFEFRSA